MNIDHWTDVLRIINSLGCLIGIGIMLTLPGGPSNGSYAFLTASLCAFAASAAYGSVALIGDPSVFRPITVSVATGLLVFGAVRLRHQRKRALNEGRDDWRAG